MFNFYDLRDREVSNFNKFQNRKLELFVTFKDNSNKSRKASMKVKKDSLFLLHIHFILSFLLLAS